MVSDNSMFRRTGLFAVLEVDSLAAEIAPYIRGAMLAAEIASHGGSDGTFSVDIHALNVAKHIVEEIKAKVQNS